MKLKRFLYANLLIVICAWLLSMLVLPILMAFESHAFPTSVNVLLYIYLGVSMYVMIVLPMVYEPPELKEDDNND